VTHHVPHRLSRNSLPQTPYFDYFETPRTHMTQRMKTEMTQMRKIIAFRKQVWSKQAWCVETMAVLAAGCWADSS